MATKIDLYRRDMMRGTTQALARYRQLQDGMVQPVTAGTEAMTEWGVIAQTVTPVEYVAKWLGVTPRTGAKWLARFKEFEGVARDKS